MPTTEEIKHQIELLHIHRQTLALFLKKQAMYGILQTPHEIIHSINHTRYRIFKIKSHLRNWSLAIEDYPDDEGKEIITSPHHSTSQQPSATHFINRLREKLIIESDVKNIKSRNFSADFIAINEKLLTIDTFSIVQSDNLSEADIIDTHQAYFALLREWPVSNFLKRLLKKNGLLCFVFEKYCDAEKILLILKQKQNSDLPIDGALTYSWVIDLATQQLYTNDLLINEFPPSISFPPLIYPGKDYLEDLIVNYQKL